MIPSLTWFEKLLAPFVGDLPCFYPYEDPAITWDFYLLAPGYCTLLSLDYDLRFEAPPVF